MPQFTYTGAEGTHYPSLLHIAGGEKVRGLVPVPGETYDLRFERDDSDPDGSKADTDPGADWEHVKAETKATAKPE